MSIVSITNAQNKLHVGDVVTVSMLFKVDSADTDPTAVYVDVVEGDGTEVTYEYGVDPEVVKDATGTYHATLPLTSQGRWRVGARGTVACAAAEDTTFYVHAYEANPTP